MAVTSGSEGLVFGWLDAGPRRAQGRDDATLAASSRDGGRAAQSAHWTKPLRGIPVLKRPFPPAQPFAWRRQTCGQ
jgi:hypothetical protein